MQESKSMKGGNDKWKAKGSVEWNVIMLLSCTNGGGGSGGLVKSIDPTRIEFIIEILPLVEPDFGQSCVIVVNNARSSTRERIRCRFPKHVTHVTTGGYFYRTTTHPNLHPVNQIKQTWYHHCPIGSLECFIHVYQTFVTSDSRFRGWNCSLLQRAAHLGSSDQYINYDIIICIELGFLV